MLRTAKRIMGLVAIFITMACSAGSKPSSVALEYEEYIRDGNLDKAYDLLCLKDKEDKKKDDYLREVEYRTEAQKTLFLAAARGIRFLVKQESINDNSATVLLEGDGPVPGKILNQYQFMARGEGDQDAFFRKAAVQVQSDLTLPREKRELTLNLLKEGGRWRIFVNYAQVARIHELIEQARYLSGNGLYEKAGKVWVDILKIDPQLGVARWGKINNEFRLQAREKKKHYFDDIRISNPHVTFQQRDSDNSIFLSYEIKNWLGTNIKELKLLLEFLDAQGKVCYELPWLSSTTLEMFTGYQQTIVLSDKDIPPAWDKKTVRISVLDFIDAMNLP